MKKLSNSILIIGAFLMLQFCLAYNQNQQESEIMPPEEQLKSKNQCDYYYRTDPMYVEGQASIKIPSEIVQISFGVETLEFQASDSLTKNAQLINNAINDIKQLGVCDKQISTTGISIYPQYISYYDQKTLQYSSKFQGYKVTNNLLIRTNLTDFAGKIIDAAVRNGVNRVDSVQFDATSKTKKKLKDELIAQAMQDSKNKAELALNPLGYKIKSIKSVNLQQEQAQPVYQNRNYAKTADFNGAQPGQQTSIFASDQTISVNVGVSYLITPKETQ